MSQIITQPLSATETGAPAIPEVKLTDIEPETIERLGQLLIGISHDGQIPSVVIRGSHLVNSGKATVEEIRDSMKDASGVVAKHAESDSIETRPFEFRMHRPWIKSREDYEGFGRLHVDGSSNTPVNVNMNTTEEGGTHVLVARAQPGVEDFPNTRKLLEEGEVDPLEVVPGSLAQTQDPLRPGDTVALAESGTHHITGKQLGGTPHLFNVDPDPEIYTRTTNAIGFTAEKIPERIYDDDLI